jgi:hypothetical protein
MNNKIIMISTELELTVHDYPVEEGYEGLKTLYELIGNGCNSFEHVMPRRLYTELKIPSHATKVPGQCVSMLVDEEGAIKDGMKPNLIGSWLYETDKHNNPIMGNIIFVGERMTDDGVDFCGIDESTFTFLQKAFHDIISQVNDKLKKQGGPK